MITLNADEVQSAIREILCNHAEEWGYDPEDEDTSAKMEALNSDLYKLFEEIVNEIEEPEDTEE